MQGRNAELDLRAGIRCSPDGQLAADQSGALAHAMEPKVSRTPLIRQEDRVDALAIIPNPQSQLPLIVAELDPGRARFIALSKSRGRTQSLARRWLRRHSELRPPPFAGRTVFEESATSSPPILGV